MKETVKKKLLVGQKFMLEMHFRKPGFTKNNEIIQKFKEAGDLKYIHQNELDKACF